MSESLTFFIISTTSKLFGNKFWWNYFNKMSLTVQMRISNNVKRRDAIYLKFDYRFFTSPTMIGLELKASIYYTIEENLVLYYSFKNLARFNSKVCLRKKHRL